MTTTYFLARLDGSGWWVIVDTFRVTHEESNMPLERVKKQWPQAVGNPDLKVLMAVKQEF